MKQQIKDYNEEEIKAAKEELEKGGKNLKVPKKLDKVMPKRYYTPNSKMNYKSNIASNTTKTEVSGKKSITKEIIVKKRKSANEIVTQTKKKIIASTINSKKQYKSKSVFQSSKENKYAKLFTLLFA